MGTPTTNVQRRLLVASAVMLLARLGLGLEEQPSDISPEDEQANPHLLTLRRESVPIRRQGKIASFKTSYSGVIAVGAPLYQEFRVVFDTGSGHIVLPSAACLSETCAGKRRYNSTASQTAVLVDSDSRPLHPHEAPDSVTIGYGTGEITGDFAQDRVCLLPHRRVDRDPIDVDAEEQSRTPPSVCVDVIIVRATEMSEQPFRSFNFDGIVGLGLDSLALSTDFSYFDVLSRSSRLQSHKFGVFLTEADDGEESELAIGGYNENRLLTPLSWSPVAMADLGYWQVEIVAVRVDGVTMDVCRDGTCRGVVDSGTSHLGIPGPFNNVLAEHLTVDAGDYLDCRLAIAPVLEFELRGLNLTVTAETYMRRLPLREGVQVGSPTGVTMTEEEARETFSKKEDKMSVLSVNVTLTKGNTTSMQQVRRDCRPRTMAVNLPAPLGPKLFILGEPVLHRYYAVFDWRPPQIGFGLAANRRNLRDPSEIIDRRGQLPEGVDSILMQKKVYIDVDDMAPMRDGGIFFGSKPLLHRGSPSYTCGLSADCS